MGVLALGREGEDFTRHNSHGGHALQRWLHSNISYIVYAALVTQQFIIQCACSVGYTTIYHTLRWLHSNISYVLCISVAGSVERTVAEQ